MLIKITQRGWEKFNDVMGQVPFKDGVSTKQIARHEALSLGSYISVVEIDEDGKELGPVSPSHELVKLQTVKAEVVTPMKRMSEVEAEQVAPATATENPAAAAKVYTREELEVIADEHGIQGLRDIAPEGVKSNSVRGLIEALMLALPTTDNPSTGA